MNKKNNYWYADWINFNFSRAVKQGTKNYHFFGSSDMGSVLHHLEDNTTRKDKTDLNPEPLRKNSFIPGSKGSIEEIQKEAEKAERTLPKSRWGSPLWFGCQTLNVPITKENLPEIDDWIKGECQEMRERFGSDYLGSYIHWNETRPHLHHIFKKYDLELKKWMIHSIPNDKKKGQKFFQDFFDSGEERMKKHCLKWKRKFLQQPTTEEGLDRKTKLWKKAKLKQSQGQDLTTREKSVLQDSILKEVKVKVVEPESLKRMKTIFKERTGFDLNEKTLTSLISHNSQLKNQKEVPSKELQSPKDKLLEISISSIENWLKKEFPNQIPQSFKLSDFSFDIEKNLTLRVETLKQRSRDYLKEHPELTRSKGGAGR